MHSANLNSWVSSDDDESDALDDFDEALGDPPPQAASPRPRVARTTASAAHRHRRCLFLDG
jgi:hypothetical protein